MTITPPSRRHRRSEDGYVLVAVIFMMVILILSLSVAIPKVREDIQRDRDEETMQRGKQYIRAVQLYYRKFNAYPPNVDALVKTNDIRFLRKKYIDPTTGKDEWKPIMWGQNKTPIVMGFFGQPLAAAVGGGIGPSGNNTPGMNPGNPGLSNPPFSNPPAPVTGSGDQSGPPSPGQGSNDTTGNPTQGTGTSTTTGSAFGSPTSPTNSGQTFGGAGIIGFSPQSPKQSILVYKKKNHYNQWEFLYSPQMDQQQMASGTGLTGQAPSGGPNPTTPAPTPITPPTTTPPQQ